MGNSPKGGLGAFQISHKAKFNVSGRFNPVRVQILTIVSLIVRFILSTGPDT